MPLKHEPINVRVSQRILWFGSEAYPLLNITRTNTLELKPNRGAAIRKHVLSVLLWLFAATLVAAAAPGMVGGLAYAAAIAVIVVKTIKLVEFLNLALYELVIETAAGSHRGLVTNNPQVVTDLSIRITDAINNPYAEFQMQVENFHLGDNITQNGVYNLGKVGG